jgi:superfamily I DNA/RNA helicase
MVQVERGEISIAHTRHLIERFREIRSTVAELSRPDTVEEFVAQWLPDGLEGIDEFRSLVLDLVPGTQNPSELLNRLIEVVSTPEIPPDVTQVRIMSLHKSKGLSSPVVVIAGCIEGLLPAAADPELSLEEQDAALEEQRRLFYVGLTRVKSEPRTNRPGVLLLTCSRRMSFADSMQSGIRPAQAGLGDVTLHTSRFIQELGPTAPRPVAG